VFVNVLENSILPELEPIEPVEETAPVKVRVPEVEVTVEPERKLEVPEKVMAPVVA